MGYALGVLGLSFEGFSLLSPEEFNAVVKAHDRHEEMKSRERWEQVRILSAYTISPHIKGGISPQKVMPFAWDKIDNVGSEVVVKSTRERFEELANKWG